MTVMEEVLTDELSDAGSIPARSTFLVRKSPDLQGFFVLGKKYDIMKLSFLVCIKKTEILKRKTSNEENSRNHEMDHVRSALHSNDLAGCVTAG